MTSFAWNASNEACFCNFCNNNIVSIIYGANSGGIISCRSSHFCFVYKASNKAFASYRVIFKGKKCFWEYYPYFYYLLPALGALLYQERYNVCVCACIHVHAKGAIQLCLLCFVWFFCLIALKLIVPFAF